MHAFWLVLSNDLLEDRRIDDNSARFKFNSWVILWTNHNSLLSTATNQFDSFCVDNRLCQSGEISIKKAFFPYVKQIDSMFHASECSVIDHRRCQNVVRASVTHSAAPRVPLFCSCPILTSSVIYYWTDAWQHSICLFYIIKIKIYRKKNAFLFLISPLWPTRK